MKTQLQIIALLLVTVLGFGCSLMNSPEKPAEKFLTAVNAHNYDEARKYSTEETKKLIDLMESMTKNAQMNSEKDSASKIVVISHTIDGDTATVFYRESDSEVQQEIKLLKVEGQWLVHIVKDDLDVKGNQASEEEDEEGLWMGDDSTLAQPVDSVPVL